MVGTAPSGGGGDSWANGCNKYLSPRAPRYEAYGWGDEALRAGGGG